MTSQLRYDSINRFISRRLISGVSFTSISFIVFKKRREAGGGGGGGGVVQGLPKKPSLDRVKKKWKKNILHAFFNKNNFIRTTRLKFVKKNKNKIRAIEARLQMQL